jgi:protein translocase SecG subunit
MTILINFLLVIEAIVAILMMLVILMQRPKSEGLGAAFGGGVTENIFGAQTTNVLTDHHNLAGKYLFCFGARPLRPLRPSQHG